MGLRLAGELSQRSDDYDEHKDEEARIKFDQLSDEERNQIKRQFDQYHQNDQTRVTEMVANLYNLLKSTGEGRCYEVMKLTKFDFALGTAVISLDHLVGAARAMAKYCEDETFDVYIDRDEVNYSGEEPHTNYALYVSW